MMNQRIEEFLVEAGIYALQTNKNDFENVLRLKFAELIIRECASIASEPSAFKPEYKILKSFGLET